MSLLAVDLGLRMGLARYDERGRLCWHRSHHMGSHARLRRAVWSILSEAEPGLQWLILEGDRRLGNLWAKAAEKRDVAVRRVAPHEWRGVLLHPREQRTGIEAKRHARQMAQQIISWSRCSAGSNRPPRTDAAEAILIGLWACLDLGWLKALPSELR